MPAQSWYQNSVYYEVYVRAFSDSNGDGKGDLRGLCQKLGYLKDLGVDCLWLLPIYPSPLKDDGYDIANFYDIHPDFGTLEDFKSLLQIAHAIGLRIIMDLVLNHTSDQHPWFQESRSSRTNPKRDWYIWRDPRPGQRPPNNWQASFGGPAWEFDPATGQYYLHLFTKEQPDVN